MSLITFSGPESFDPLEAYRGVMQLSDLIKRYLNLYSKDEQKSYGVGTT